MPIQHSWTDPNTGASLGQAITVIGKVTTDTASQSARIECVTYVGLSQYSAGLQPIPGAGKGYDVTASAYLNGIDGILRSRAQAYVAGLPEYSGGTIV